MSEKKTGLLARLTGAAKGFRNQRQFERHDSGPQLTIRIEKIKYKTIDWSIGGFRINMPEATVTKGDVIDGEIVGGIRRVKDRKISMRVARIKDNGDVGFQITELSHEAFSALNELNADKASKI